MSSQFQELDLSSRKDTPGANGPVRLNPSVDWPRDLVEHSRDLICIHDLKGNLRFVNPVPACQLGHTVEELLRLPMRDFIAPEFRPQFDDYLKEIAAKGEARGLLAVLTRAGERRVWEYHNTLRKEADGEALVRGIAHDVTDRVAAERALQTTNKMLEESSRARESALRDLRMFRTLLDQSLDGIEVIDVETFRIVDVNEREMAQLGYTREELMGMTVLEINPTISREHLQRKLPEFRRLGALTIETEHRRKDGTTFPVEVTLKHMVLDREYAVGIVRDISERKKAEEALRQSEQRYRSVVAAMSEGILSRDATGTILACNPSFERLLGVTREQLIGTTAADWEHRTIHEDGTPFLGAEHPAMVALRTGQPQSNICMGFRRADETVCWLSINAQPMFREEASKPYAVVTTFTDITERKKAEEELRISEERMRLAQEAAALGTFERNMQTGEGYWSRQTEEMFGLEPGTGPNSIEAFLNLVHVEDRERVSRLITESAKKGHAEGEWRIVWPDGSIHWINGRWKVLFDEQGRPLRAVGIDADITERKRAEEVLLENEARERERAKELETILDTLPIPVMIAHDPDCRHMTTNRAGAESLRMPYASNVSMSAPAEELPPFRFVRDGVEIPAAELPMQMAAATGKPVYDVVTDVLLPDGTVRNEIGNAAPLFGEDGKVRGAVGAAIDITERKKAEEAIATLEQYVQTESSESFFTSMALQLARCLEADHTYIGELVAGEDKVKTLGVCSLGAIANNVDYDLPNSPCERVVSSGPCSYVSGVCQAFPKDLTLQQLNAEGYVGTPLRDSQGRVLGIMAAAFQSPLANAKFAEMILQLFSTRTAGQIERKRNEEALRQSEERFRLALSVSPIKVFNQDRDLRYTWIYNPPPGWTAEDYLGKTDEEVFGPVEGARMRALKEKVLETGERTRLDYTLTARGHEYYCDLTIEPMRDSAGKIVGVSCAVMDLTHILQITEELRVAKEKVTEEKLYLEHTINTEMGFEEIIGKSSGLKAVMEQAAKVATSDATVLLLGETGVGKELIARAIHRLSRRKENSFIKMNCAAIPHGLLESELFGAEKGAYTGSVSRKIGRLELADKGTIFLDEIGEIELSLQPKLLRVLQDQEFERLGGTQTIKVDFRLIAATNRDLVECVKNNQFRRDLYYRLNVFPIRIPSLRERRDDIPLLVEHFVHKCARRMNKSIASIPKKTMNALVAWDWPGNIRELENFIERSVILTHGSLLTAPLGELQATFQQNDRVETLEAAERSHILRALQESHGLISGPRGAAARLGLKRTTLQSKLKHLGINPRMMPQA